MAQTLPSGIKKFDPTDTVSRAAFNENWDTINGHLAAATSAATANTIAKRDAAGRMKVAAPAAADDVARKAEIDAPPFITTTGTGAAYVATFSPAYSTLVAGTRITVKFHVANTGSATINVNGLGAKSILRSGGVALTAGIIKLNAVMSLVYDGSAFILQGEGGNGNATAADLLIGKTASVDTGDIVGTMFNRTGHVTGVSISRDGTTLRIRPQPGYVPGDAANSVQWDDPNWIAENIPEDIIIFGLQGTKPNHIFASGSASVPKNMTNISGMYYYVLEVRGLSFRPNWISFSNDSQYTSGGASLSPNGREFRGTIVGGLSSAPYSEVVHISASDTTLANVILYDDGFRIPIYRIASNTASTYNVRWKAGVE